MKRNGMLKMVIGIAAFAVLIAPGYSQLVFDPSSKAPAQGFEVGGLVSYSTIEYKAKDDDGNGTEKIKRIPLVGFGAFGINEIIDVVVGAGFIAKAEPESLDASGNGFVIGGGLKGTIYNKDALRVFGYGAIQYLNESYGTSKVNSYYYSYDVDESGTSLEFLLGAGAGYDISENVNAYGAIELVPYSDGQFKAESGGNSAT